MFTKHVLLLLLVQLTGCFVLCSQPNDDNEGIWPVSISVGGNYSFILADAESVVSWDLDRRIGPSIGLTTKLRTTGILSIFSASVGFRSNNFSFSSVVKDQPFSGYIEQRVGGNLTKGYVDDAYFSGVSRGYYKLNYLTLEVQLNASMVGPFWIPRFGMYVGRLLHGRNEVEARGTVALGAGLPAISTTFVRFQDYRHQLKDWDVGLSGTIEFFNWERLRMALDLKYGLTSVYKSSLDAPQGEFRNLSGSLMLVYNLRQ